jgi:TolB protein
MDYTDLFEILPPSRMPAARTGANVDFEAYRSLGVEFLIRSSYGTANGKPQAELRLFDISKGTQIVGRLYPLVSPSSQPARELAHYAGNDVIQALTGEPGIFRTRLLMSCGQKTKEIYIMDFDGQNIRQLTRDRNFALSPSWAPDGKRILFTSYKPAVKGGALNPNLYLYDMSSNQRRLVSAARGLNTGGVFHPRENKVAYTFSINGKPEIYVHDLNANTRKRVTQTQFFSVEPSWSPDGTRLTYSSSRSGSPHIYISNADGGALQRLTFAGVYNSSPNWSPRGDRIVFAGQDNRVNNFNIFMIDPSGSNLVRLTDGSRSSENPVFSPDGRHIAYSSDTDGQYRIYVMTARGTRVRVLTPKNIGPCKQPSWSPRL